MNHEGLNRQDVANLSQNASTENKSVIAQKLGAFYSGSNLSPRAIKLAEDIFRIMVHDAEIKVRETLSSSLKHCTDLPQDVVRAILKDKDNVAIPFLQYYDSLTSEDLIRLLNVPSINRQKAIAQRRGLTDKVSHYIAEYCSDEVVGELISNEQADIDENTFNMIISKYSENDDIKKRLVYRSEVPASIFEKIVDKLSYKLKTHLILHHNLSQELASKLVDEIKEKITLSISEEYSSDEQIEELVHQLYKANHLTSELVVRAVCLGDLKFFEYALVYLSETSIAEVRKILFNTQADFMIRNLLRKAFIPKNAFPAVFSALKIIRGIKFDCGRSNRKAFGHKVVERILSYVQNTDELNPDDIKYLVSKIS